MTINTFFLRISVCFILSILIGLERQYRHRMIGLRTNVLVSLGAFMFVIVSFGISSVDNSRIASQVVSGIGFLGAGVILRDGSKVKGLNTAATLWCVAAIGVLCAAGMLFEASVGTFFVLISNIVLRIFSIKIMEYIKRNNQSLYNIKIKCAGCNELEIRKLILNSLEKSSIILDSLEKTEIKNEVTFKLTISSSSFELLENLINNLSINVNVIKIKWNKINCKKIDDEEEIID